MIADFPFGTILLLQLPGYLEVATEYIIGGNTKVVISRYVVLQAVNSKVIYIHIVFQNEVL